MFRGYTILNSRWGNHILFWSGFILVNGFVWGYCDQATETNYFTRSYLATISELPLLMLAVYFNLYYLLPKFFITKRYVPYLLMTAGSYLIIAFGIRAVFYYGLHEVYNHAGRPVSYFDLYYLGRIMLLGISPLLIISTVIKLGKISYQHQKRTQELQKEKLDAELKFLKAQIHPHFLFNTLNNIYSLALKKSDKAPQMLLKLSELMSYMLYDTQENKIALDKEIKHIQNYIELEKLRHGDRLNISFTVSGSAASKYIAPLVLMPFVENAFKHGVSQNIDNAWITIGLVINDDDLVVKVENSQNMTTVYKENNGIGLINVKRRLNLVYPDHHDLRTEKETDRYSVDLRLSLA